jgi:metallo-beta-lactamase family protein
VNIPNINNNRYWAKISHHGAVNGVTGSCHELHIDSNNSILIDCGLFQGSEASPHGSNHEQLAIDFPIKSIKALIVTHVHIDHVGRIPYLLAAGFDGPIFCSRPSALLLPEVLEDAVKIGFTKNRHLIAKFVRHIKSRLIPLEYGEKRIIPLPKSEQGLVIKLRQAGHILGSAYVECEIQLAKSNNVEFPESSPQNKHKVVFSGDLGAPYAPLLAAPKSPYGCDQLIIEGTYGDKIHENRKYRQLELKKLIENALQNKGVVLIPAFSIGRTQELLYELENIIHRSKAEFLKKQALIKTSGSKKSVWHDIEIIVDSPLASEFTEKYRQLSKYWDAEAQKRRYQGRHPLDFSQMITINDHETHLETVNYLKQSARPAIVISASGMCTSGRIVNYLKALLGDPKTDILFTGYQAQGTPGREIQQYGQGGYVRINREKYIIKAQVYTLSGYSAHADQFNLLNFVKRMKNKPQKIHIVHGDKAAKTALQSLFESSFPEIDVLIPDSIKWSR